MRKRRRTKFTWLPGDGTTVTAGAIQQDVVAFSLQVNLGTGTDSALSSGLVSNVIADFNPPEDTGQTSMADSLGSEYLLKRIVGKVFVEAFQEGIVGQATTFTLGEQNSAIVSCGFFVAPYSYDTATRAPNIGQPIGIEGDPHITPYNPNLVQVIREPWIWRRSWLLTPGGSLGAWDYPGAQHQSTIAADFALGAGTFPSNNTGFPGVLDGPHVDAKTARRIRKHERLWFAMQGTLMPEGSTVDPDKWSAFRIRSVVDVRCLGMTRKAHNRSSFE